MNSIEVKARMLAASTQGAADIPAIERALEALAFLERSRDLASEPVDSSASPTQSERLRGVGSTPRGRRA